MSQPQSLTIEQAIALAKKETNQGNTDIAIQLYSKVLQQEPENATAKKALQDIQQNLQVNGKDQSQLANPPQDQLNSLVSLYRAGQLLEAEQKCKAILLNYPNSLFVHNVHGVVLQSQDKLQEAAESYTKAIELKPDYAEAFNNRGVAYQGLGRLEEAVSSCDKAIQFKPAYAEAYYNRANALKGLEKFDDAIESYSKAIEYRPDYAEAIYNLGTVFQELGKLKEAVESYKKTAQYKPNDAFVCCNLGVTLQKLGHAEEAIENYDRAIELKPENAKTHSDRGLALQSLGRLDGAIESYEQAIKIDSEYANAHYNLGSALFDLGRPGKAIESYQAAVSIEPDNVSFWTGMSIVLSKLELVSYSEDLASLLLQILEQPNVNPRYLSAILSSCLRHHSSVESAVEKVKTGSNLEVAELVGQLSAIPLLLRVMELSHIADLDIESLLTKVREELLGKVIEENSVEGFPFYIVLAKHCFANEYVFSEGKEESKKVEQLQSRVQTFISDGNTLDPTWIAVLAAYRPLNSFPWAEKLLEIEWPKELQSVIVCQVGEIQEERSLRSSIACLTEIEDDVSQLVRDQYEASPYPRWVKAALGDKPRTIAQICKLAKLHLDVEAQDFTEKPNILIAGCGTGQQVLESASAFLDCQVLAVDLSLSSLSYAMRKTKELGVKNIEYMQADILSLGMLDRQFDIVESAGVLHHMENPIAGWQVLVERLRTGGLMKIALYSEFARKGVVEARKQIAKNNYAATSEGIRLFRESLIEQGENVSPEMTKLTKCNDFYTLSECRDLLFHVQEHRFTLPQIEEALNELGLEFLGFELPQQGVRRKFKEMFPEKESLVSLSKWHQFELENPDTFIGMYQFWLQKQ